LRATSRVEFLLSELLEATRTNGAEIITALHSLGVTRRYLREDEAAKYIGQTPFFVGELIRSRRIRAIKPAGAKYRVIDTRDLDKFMAEQRGRG
jgi:excisionase family DNA binding protein